MKVLTIKQPWASLIIEGYKKIIKSGNCFEDLMLEKGK